MSELKFACPVCGQHIKCDATKSGSQMECPTCFRKMVVPQASAGEDTKFVLSAAAVTQRLVPGTLPVDNPGAQARASRTTAVMVIAAILLAGAAAGAVFAFRDKLFKLLGKPMVAGTNSPSSGETNRPFFFAPAPAGSETNWTLNLAERPFPESRAAGQVNGRGFALDKATVQGGVLTFRQGAKTPAEMSVTVHLFAKQGEDLAGQSVTIDPTWTNAPKVNLRWKDEQQQPVTRTYRDGYALKIQFGAVTGGQLPGRIYLCVPDEGKSFVAGTFAAEIRKPSPPKPSKTSKPAKPVAPKR